MFGSNAMKRSARPIADGQIAAYLITRGNEARDARDWARAALCFEEALRLVPERADIQIQWGQVLKKAGNFEGAEKAYLAAHALNPSDSNLAFQLGHFYKDSGRRADARTTYQRALMLRPGWKAVEDELAALSVQDERIPDGASASESLTDVETRITATAEGLMDSGRDTKLAPGLAPRDPKSLLQAYSAGLTLWRMGQHEPSQWGVLRTVRGPTAIRGQCISSDLIDEVQLLLDGNLFYRGPVRGPYALKYAVRPTPLEKYVFNIWYDFSGLGVGRHAFELRVIDATGDARSFHDIIVVAPPLREAEFPDSDTVVESGDLNPEVLEQRIRCSPSMVRSAKRRLLPREPRNILVLRTDQLGDMVASVPAMRRLREIFSLSKIVGLLTAANAEFAATLGLFDEIIVADFPDDSFERRRLMPLTAQEELRRRLAPYAFDLAIDLAQASVSRELLLLSGAPFLYGVAGEDFHWLSADFALNTRDPLNRLDIAPHSRKVLALVETLGAIVRDRFAITRRDDLYSDRLQRFGIMPDDRYALLHMGARVAFSRWPGFPQLAKLLLEKTDLKVVMMTEDPDVRATLPPQLPASPRFQLLDERLAFDDFDAFISFATVLIGNDSGPKHLASLRGTPAITLHTARINWNTWGHEGTGSIISRRVPCAGCDIFHDGEDCGKDFACIRDIRPEEVFDAVKAQLGLIPGDFD